MTPEERRTYNRQYRQLRAQRLERQKAIDAELQQASSDAIDQLSALSSKYSYSAGDLRTHIGVIVKAYRLKTLKIKEGRA